MEHQGSGISLPVLRESSTRAPCPLVAAVDLTRIDESVIAETVDAPVMHLRSRINKFGGSLTAEKLRCFIVGMKTSYIFWTMASSEHDNVLRRAELARLAAWCFSSSMLSEVARSLKDTFGGPRHEAAMVAHSRCCGFLRLSLKLARRIPLDSAENTACKDTLTQESTAALCKLRQFFRVVRGFAPRCIIRVQRCLRYIITDMPGTVAHLVEDYITQLASPSHATPVSRTRSRSEASMTDSGDERPIRRRRR